MFFLRKLCLFQGYEDIVEMSVFPKLIYAFNSTSVKILVFFMETDHLILKLIWT